jgi:beta-glucanase (GH16 family)
MTRSILLAVLVAAASGASAQNWQVVWADEFDEPGAPDPARWAYDIGGGGWGNQESQFYTNRPENVRVEGGALVIEAREEAYNGNAYTSARLVTRGTAAWIYGRIEARIQLPQGQGIWPAFWMLPTNSPYGTWPAGGEIDVMEFLGHDTDRVYGTLHYGGGELGHRSTGTNYTLASGTFPDAFHTFAVEWEPRRMRWYVDGQLYQTQVSWTSAGGPYPAPFDSPFHLLLNVAVGGEWPGYPDASTVFPQQMLVDYVRVYQDADAYPQVSLDAPASATPPTSSV